MTKDQISWNILHTNFEKSNWRLKDAKDGRSGDLREASVSFDEMAKHKVFQSSGDLRVEETGHRHFLSLFVSPDYVYDELHGVGEEYWLLELVVKVNITASLITPGVNIFSLFTARNSNSFCLSLQVGNDNYNEDHSILFGFEFLRTYKIEEKLTVTLDKDSLNNADVVVEAGIVFILPSNCINATC